MLDDKEIFESIYSKLFIHHKLLKGLVVNIDQANNLIKKAKNFNQILYVLNYLGNSFPNLIKILIKNFEKICEMIDVEGKEKKTENKNYIFKIENYSIPNCNDNLEEIYSNLVLLILHKHKYFNLILLY